MKEFEKFSNIYSQLHNYPNHLIQLFMSINRSCRRETVDLNYWHELRKKYVLHWSYVNYACFDFWSNLKWFLGAWPTFARRLSVQQQNQNSTRLKLNLFLEKRFDQYQWKHCSSLSNMCTEVYISVTPSRQKRHRKLTESIVSAFRKLWISQCFMQMRC